MKIVTLKKKFIHTGNLILVNRQYPYQENSMECKLLPVDPDVNVVQLEAKAVQPLSGIIKQLDAREQIKAVSGWRSRQEQEEIYSQSLKENGISFTKKYVALPGHSEHQTGLAIDLAENQPHIDFLCPDFPYTGICQTFRERAGFYGFIERYPKMKERVTEIGHEPWHFRYVGAPHAAIMAKHDFVLEEYICFLKNYPYGKNHYSFDVKDRCVMISYLEAAKTEDTRFEVDDNISYAVSGNNIDGYIITQWEKKKDEQ